MKRNAPRGRALRILRRSIHIVTGFIQEQCRTEDRGTLGPRAADILIVALPIDKHAVSHARGPRCPVVSRLVRIVAGKIDERSEEHTSELQSPCNLVCRLLLEKKKKKTRTDHVSDTHERHT